MTYLAKDSESDTTFLCTQREDLNWNWGDMGVIQQS